MKKHPDVIITATKGSNTRYVLNAPFGADNKRRPSYTDDVEKARRFFNEEEAKNYISRFIPQPGYVYGTETFIPVSIL